MNKLHNKIIIVLIILLVFIVGILLTGYFTVIKDPTINRRWKYRYNTKRSNNKC